MKILREIAIKKITKSNNRVQTIFKELGYEITV